MKGLLKTDGRIPLYLWPAAMAGFEEDEEDAGPSYHHEPGRSLDMYSKRAKRALDKLSSFYFSPLRFIRLEHTRPSLDVFVQVPLPLIQLYATG